jgi:hypothetical protein
MVIGDMTDPPETLNRAASTFKSLSCHDSKTIHFLDLPAWSRQAAGQYTYCASFWPRPLKEKQA